MIQTDGLADCPFCGGSSEYFNTYSHADVGQISCPCGASMKCQSVDEHYEQLEGNIYRKIEKRYGFQIAKERWNRRAGINGDDMVKVRHGRWERSEGSPYPYCSNCGCESLSRAERPYCQFCGAKMDGDEE